MSSRWVRLGAIGASVVAVVAIASWCAVFALNDDDGDSPPADGNGGQTATPATTPTTAATSTAAGTASPAATSSPAASPTTATATTAAQSPTQGATATTAPPTATATRPPATTAPTSAPTTAPTATATLAPTNTPTPTATPTATPTPTATATPTTAPITNFAGTWHSAATCDNAEAPFRWIVSLTQQGALVNGSIKFHKCPGEGRAEYAVSGTATSAGTIQLIGTKTFGIGGLDGIAPYQVPFTIAPLGTPNPNYAP